MPHPEENRQEYLLFRPSKAGLPMILALHLGQFKKTTVVISGNHRAASGEGPR